MKSQHAIFRSLSNSLLLFSLLLLLFSFAGKAGKRHVPAADKTEAAMWLNLQKACQPAQLLPLKVAQHQAFGEADYFATASDSRAGRKLLCSAGFIIRDNRLTCRPDGQKLYYRLCAMQGSREENAAG